MACKTILADIKGHQHVQQQVEEPVRITVEVTLQNEEDLVQDFPVEEAKKEDRDTWDYKRYKRLKLAF